MGDITAARLRKQGKDYLSKDGYVVSPHGDDWLVSGRGEYEMVSTLQEARNFIARCRVARLNDPAFSRYCVGKDKDILFLYRSWKAEQR